MTQQELDVRPLRKPDKHPAIFAAYAELRVGGSFVLVNDHDPKHLREEFESDHGGSFGWQYLTSAGPDGLRYLTVHRRRQALVLDPSWRPAPAG
ncbi:MAG TPA: DUF2249 domain-containing protein [Streptosporangiaceae bacterium]